METFARSIDCAADDMWDYFRSKGAQSDISVVTGLDSLQDDGHRLVLAGLSPVVAENPEADCIIMAEWSNQDYEVLLDLVYGEESSLYGLSSQEADRCLSLLAAMGAQGAQKGEYSDAGSPTGRRQEVSPGGDRMGGDLWEEDGEGGEQSRPTAGGEGDVRAESITLTLVKCVYCRKFKTMKNMPRHIKEAHSNRTGQAKKRTHKNKSEIKADTKMFKCPLPCGQAFMRKSQLDLHKTRKTCYFNINFACPYCERPCANENIYQNHINNKKCPKQFSCQFCNMFFFKEFDRNDHIRLSHAMDTS